MEPLQTGSLVKKGTFQLSLAEHNLFPEEEEEEDYLPR